MSARAIDTIYWGPLGARDVPPPGLGLVHLCPQAVLVTTTPRECLDPMALGTCRYCHEPLPVPA